MSLPAAGWYFDLISPFAYLQWQQREKLAGLVKLRPVPVVLGALLSHWEQKGPAEIPPKRLQTYRRCQWYAEHLGIPFRFPPAHPFNPIAALRLIVACGASEAAVDAVFGAVFGEGRDISDMAVLEEIGRKLGIEDMTAAIARPEVKAQLRANTDAAIARGVFGVPTVDVGGELFWGEDATGMLLDYLKNPALFAGAEMLRLQQLPIAAQRDTAKKPA
jgi:2-hydroxychromene-2-carboxylate isomerase